MNDTNDTDDLDRLPEWCNVFDGLSDEEIDAILEIVLTRADLTREFDVWFE